VIRSRFGRTLLLIAGLLGWAHAGPTAQALPPVSPFDIVGFIDAATLDAAGDGYSGGGTITVNGTRITVPANTLLQMPAFALTWQEVFTQAPTPWGPAQSGLARRDTPAPATTFEVHVQGNRVGNEYIAALMFISQQSLNAGQGFINYIDYDKGEMRVGGKIGDAATGARVVLNDPQGKFGRAHTHDARFTIDEDNPTVRSETAYPMCLPRVTPGTVNADGAKGDPRCPESNRPKNQDGTYQTVFTTDYPPLWVEWGLVPGGFQGNNTNPLEMAPFEVGDYVTYNGALTSDGDGAFVSAWSVIANVGIFTQPGSQPTYTAIDVMLLGVGGAPDPNLPQEAAVRTRIEGFTTDPSSFIMLYAVDVDSCTGQESERYYDMVAVDPGPPGAKGVGAVAGRWRWRPSLDAPFLPPTRMLRAVSTNGTYMDWDNFDPSTNTTTPGGIRDAGQYSPPNFEFIFPENLGIGTTPVPGNYQDFPFLANGSGPYYGAVPGESPLGILGQLKPWPGAVAPVTPICPADGSPAVFSPIADAGPNHDATIGSVVTLDAGNSRDTTTPTKMPLTFTWTQVNADGSDVIDPTKKVAGTDATLPFDAPQDLAQLSFRLDKYVRGNIQDGDILRFRVDVSNCSPWSAPGSCGRSSATVAITARKSATPTDTLTAVTATFRLRRSRLDVSASTSDPNAVLTVLGFGDMGPALPIAPGVPAPPTDRAYTQVGVNPPPTSITVRSSSGGTATVPVTMR